MNRALPLLLCVWLLLAGWLPAPASAEAGNAAPPTRQQADAELLMGLQEEGVYLLIEKKGKPSVPYPQRTCLSLVSGGDRTPQRADPDGHLPYCDENREAVVRTKANSRRPSEKSPRDAMDGHQRAR